jgi:hypothetical protein
MATKTLLVAFAFLLNISQAHASKFEKGFGIGTSFYSGSEKTSLIPGYTLDLTFSANHLASKTINLVHRFNFSVLTTGSDFGGEFGQFNGISGGYNGGLRINFAKYTTQPYLGIGPGLALYSMLLNSAPKNGSKSQNALKYGVWIAAGVDFLKDETGRGTGTGWGIDVAFSRYFPSPSIIEFPAKKLDATSIKIEIHFLVSPDT